jgi:hypothetical protein
VEQAGLAAFLADLDQDRYPPSDWRAAFLKRFYQLWLDEQYRQIPALGLFRGARHQDLIAEFQKLDRATLGIAPRRVLHSVLGQRPPISPAAAATSERRLKMRKLTTRRRSMKVSSISATRRACGRQCCAGFRIDLGVVHRDQPGRYVLGIECDGATYHSSKTARDRDRLRQEVLEGLGWRIHRIWSADWVRDRAREVQRTIDVLEAAYRAVDASAPIAPPPRAALGDEPSDPSSDQPLQSSPSMPPLLTLPASEAAPRRAADQLKPYIEAHLPARADADQFNTPSAAASTIPLLITRCVQAEGPVHVDRVIELIARSYGFQRTRERVADQINRSIDRAVRQQKVVRRGEFLWPPGLVATEAPVRTSGPGGKPRAIDRIALEEIANALLLTLDECFSLPEETLIVQTARLLGYDRTGVLVTARLMEAIQMR